MGSNAQPPGSIAGHSGLTSLQHNSSMALASDSHPSPGLGSMGLPASPRSFSSGSLTSLVRHQVGSPHLSRLEQQVILESLLHEKSRTIVQLTLRLRSVLHTWIDFKLTRHSLNSYLYSELNFSCSTCRKISCISIFSRPPLSHHRHSCCCCSSSSNNNLSLYSSKISCPRDLNSRWWPNCLEMVPPLWELASKDWV